MNNHNRSDSEIEQVIALARHRILERTSPARIILYGSYACDKADPDSDLDLLVLFDELSDRRTILSEIYDALSSIPLPKDVVIATVDEHARFKDVPNNLHWTASRQGRILHDSYSGSELQSAPDLGGLIHYWLRRADGHLLAASRALESREESLADASCYHSHEAVAKYLRALLTYHGTQEPRTHDLEYVHKLLRVDRRLEVPDEDLRYLATYGIERYWEPDLNQAEHALRIAKHIAQQVRVDVLVRH